MFFIKEIVCLHKQSKCCFVALKVDQKESGLKFNKDTERHVFSGENLKRKMLHTKSILNDLGAKENVTLVATKR